MNSRPILIVGAPRSGTTLLTTMLNAHPAIFLVNESKLFIDFLPESPEASRDLVAVAARLVEAAAERGLVGLPDPSTLAKEAGSRDVAGLLRRLFEILAANQGKARWGEKTAVAYRRLAAIRRAFPDACYVGLERPLPSVATSYARVNPQWGEAGGVLHWLDFRRAVAREGKSLPFLLVSYPELVEQPEATLRHVCEFIGEEYHPAMLEYHTTRRAKELAGAPEFAGASRPVFVRSGESQTATIPGRLVRSAEAYASRLDRERRDVLPPLWLPFLRAFVYARLLVRETLGEGIGVTLRKIWATATRGRS